MDQASSATLPEPGALIAGKYRIEAVVNRGGMGAIFAARNEGTGGRVALKWMLPKLLSERSARERFIREAQLGARIEHPNVVQVFDIGEDRGSLFLVMSLLQGESLGSRLSRGPLPVLEALRILHGAASGVAAAHALGIVHRDLKPDNIFLAEMPNGRPPEPKVLDFGISKVRDGGVDLALTGAGSMLGTPHYMAEEQVRSAVDVDARADTYALGVILYECLSGRRPFEGSGFGDLVLQIATEAPTSIQQLVPGLDPHVGALVMRAMSRPRDARFPNAAAMADAMAALPVWQGMREAASTTPYPGQAGYVTPLPAAQHAWTPAARTPSGLTPSGATPTGATPANAMPTPVAADPGQTPFSTTSRSASPGALPRPVVIAAALLALLVVALGVVAVVLLRRGDADAQQAGQPPVQPAAPAPAAPIAEPEQELNLDAPIAPEPPPLPVGAPEPAPEQVLAPAPAPRLPTPEASSAKIKRRPPPNGATSPRPPRPAAAPRSEDEGLDPWGRDIGQAWELGDEPDAPRR